MNNTWIRDVVDRMNAGVGMTKGVSMRPLLWSGVSYVGICPVKGTASESEYAREPQIDDIVVFEEVRRATNTPIMHRLIAKEGDVYVTRGDNCLYCERFRRESIVGIVTDIYWLPNRKPWNRCYWLAYILGAKRDGSLSLNVNSPRYLQYVRFWNRTWPMRRVYYWLRHKTYRLLRGGVRLLRGLFRPNGQ